MTAVLNSIWRFLADNYMSIIFGINILLGVVLVFYERKNPATMWAWLLIMFFVPVVGFLLYLYFGHDLRKQKLFQTKHAEDMHRMASLQQRILDRGVQDEEIRSEIRLATGIEERYVDMVRMLLTSSQAVLSEHNTVNLFTDGADLFAAMKKDLEGAKEYIFMQSYIFRCDHVGDEIMDILCRKAKEGVEVCLLMDGMGCRTECRRLTKRLEKAGGKAATFFPTMVPYVSLRINFRNHRKITVIDGEVGYVGGFNVGKEYVGEGKLGYWRDTHLRLRGPAIDDLELRFRMDFDYASKKKINHQMLYGRFRSPEIRFYESVAATGTPISDVTMQIVTSGPDSTYQTIRNGYVKMISEAEQKIWIETPYLILDDVLKDSLSIAALSGIDVSIIIPKKADHLMIDGANMSYVGELLESGVKIYRYTEGFIHSKTVTVDGKLASVGTANLDIRSFKLDFEVNAFAYNRRLAEVLDESFDHDIENAEAFTLEDYAKRSHWMRFKEAIMRLIAPLL